MMNANVVFHNSVDISFSSVALNTALSALCCCNLQSLIMDCGPIIRNIHRGIESRYPTHVINLLRTINKSQVAKFPQFSK